MDSYQPTGKFEKKKKKEELVFDTDSSNKVEVTSYRSIGDVPSFDNPLYESNPTPETFELPGVATPSDPTYEDIKDIKLDQYEVPNLKSNNPYEF